MPTVDGMMPDGRKASEHIGDMLDAAVRPAKTPPGEHNPCREAQEQHSMAHARWGGSWIMACDEGWCGCAKDCGREECPTCPSEDGPA